MRIFGQKKIFRANMECNRLEGGGVWSNCARIQLVSTIKSFSTCAKLIIQNYLFNSKDYIQPLCCFGLLDWCSKYVLIVDINDEPQQITTVEKRTDTKKKNAKNLSRKTKLNKNQNPTK